MSAQRRPVTYGKQASQNAFSSGFDRLDIASPSKSKSRLLKPVSLSPSTARARHVDLADPFDVPLSDSDHDGWTPRAPSPPSRHASPVKKLNKPLNSAVKSPNATRQSRADAAARTGSLNGKRRRTPSISYSRHASRATTPAADSKDTAAKAGRKARAISVEPASSRTAVKPTTGRTPTTAPAASRKQASKHPRQRQTTPSAAPRDRSAAVEATPSPRRPVIDTIEEADEDVFDVPIDDSMATSHDKSRPAKIRKTQRLSTPRSELVMSPPSRVDSTSPRAAKLVTTPRQAKIWSNLLDDDTGIDAHTSPDFMKRTDDAHPATPRSKVPRVRLIDTLKSVELLDSDSDQELEQSQRSRRPASTLDEIPSSQGDEAHQSLLNESSQPGSQPNGPRITYAQQRSYLQDDPQTLDQLLAQPLELDESPTTVRKHASVDQDDEEDLDNNGMKTIHELRAAGDELRFDDDMNTTLDDISSKDKSGISGKRSSLMDLAAKLTGPHFKERLVGKSLEYEIFSRCEAEADPISGTALCICLARIVSEPCDPRSAQLVLEAGALSIVGNMMDLTKDLRSIARDRKTNMARLAQTTVAEMAQSLEHTQYWKGFSPLQVTPQLVAARALELLVRRLRESGVKASLLNSSMVDHLTEMLKSSLKVSLDQQPLAFVKTNLALSVLESATVAPACALDATLWKPESLKVVSQTVTNLVGSSSTAIVDLQLLALRLCLNLANNSHRGSAAFANPDLIGHLMASINSGFKDLSAVLNDHKRQNEFDELVLALGATFNLAEMNEDIRLLMANEHPHALTRMVKTFVEAREKADQADSLEASQANVAFGYLSVLLANVCITTAGRTAVCQALPGGDIKPVVEAIDEFIKHHQSVDQQGQSEMWTAFTGRLQSVADRLRS